MSNEHPPSAISRRRFLQLGGATGAALFLGATSTAGTLAARRAPAAGPVPAPAQEAGVFRMASWIGYIDVDEYLAYPSLDRFTAETGITIDYQEAVEGNEEFFASDIRGPLEAGVPTGWDICVLTDWMVQRLIALGWLETIEPAGQGRFPANLLESYTARDWDPGNRYAAPWQSGMTGIGHDAAVTGDLSSVSVFFGPDWAGRMTYLSELNETGGLAAIHLGYTPETLDQAQFDACIATISDAIAQGWVRRVTGNSYIEDMTTGDVVVAMAWSGDVLSLLVPDQRDDQDFRFVLPDEGGMRFTDNMVIPKGAEHKASAEAFIDWYYDPANAAPIEAYVQYVCPVKGAAEAIATIDPAAASNLLMFPDEAMQARTHDFVSLSPDQRAAWEAAFAAAIGL